MTYCIVLSDFRRRVRPASESGITRPTPTAVGVDADPTTSKRKHAPRVDTQLQRKDNVSDHSFLLGVILATVVW